MSKKYLDFIIYRFPKKFPRPIIYASALATTFGVACFIKESMGRRYDKKVKAVDKVVLVTGANTGIGKETVRDLAKRGARVHMACRNLKKCEETRAEIVLDTENKYVYCHECDLASLASIRKFAENFKKKHDKLDVLINNAGVMRYPKHKKTMDGFELQLGVNHMGHFYLTNLLLDTLIKSAPSRIINVSSVAHLNGKIKKDDLNCEKDYHPAAAYAQSKLANMLFTKELSKRLQGTGVTVNAVHPGIVDSEITRHMSFYSSWFSTIFIYPFVWPFLKSPAQGSQTIVYAAIDPTLAKETGKYYKDFKETLYATVCDDESLTKWLWLVSEKWTKLEKTLDGSTAAKTTV